MRRLLLVVALPAVVAIVPGAMFIGLGVALYLRLRERNRVTVIFEVSSYEVHTRGVTLLSFPPRRQPWVRA